MRLFLMYYAGFIDENLYYYSLNLRRTNRPKRFLRKNNDE